MKKIFTTLLSTASVWAGAGFDFGECSGSGTFKQQINLKSNVKVGTIPAGIKGLHVELISDKDVDVRLYGANNDKVVHWPKGILSKGSKETKTYKNVPITYSGYNGTNGKKGHEFIDVKGTVPTKLTMKAYGYRAGYATVNYSWTGTENCKPGDKGKGTFKQDILKKAISVVGDIPAGIENLNIELTSSKDIDIQLYGEDGTAIIAYPNGLLNEDLKQEIDYNGMHIEWSGWGGINGDLGHEYIKVTPKITEKLTMKVFGYKAGNAVVDYSWGEDPDCLTRRELKAKIRNKEDVTSVNTSCITDMSYLFKFAYFNQDISDWNVSKVTNMQGMFQYAGKFNQDISSWDVSNVTNMSFMFYDAYAFNQDISDWNVSNVTNMSNLFQGTNFNQDISSWDVSHVTNMVHMFYSTRKFNQDISDWNVSNVTDMSGMISSSDKFNQDISKWNVSKVQDTDFRYFANHSPLEDKHNPFYYVPTVVASGFVLSATVATQQVELESTFVGFDKNTVTYEWREGKNNVDGVVISTAPSFTYALKNYDPYGGQKVYLTLTVKDASGAVATTTRYFEDSGI